ncbi:type II secretion system secretin GspD [Rhodoplanes roseus]|uniref:Type II secretion system protein GspD n=1 Tax=Rhodoplanes roseus TaxID=29409 RepID=A0A327L273_9BRAD|nr:type II secretion system secretin GspD [Rhodoplanes roseus]RAI43582.1 type II secretion system protein GspD [Rhodoplanes roseus]
MWKERPGGGSHPGGIGVACTLLVVAVLSACNALPDDTRPPGVLDHVRALDLLPRQAAPGGAPASGPDDRRAVEYHATTAAPPVATRSADTTASTSGGSEGYELNFENTPLTTVAKVVLGDIMGVGYTIDPRVQGTVSLASGRPVAKSDLLYVLESALRTSNIALIRDVAGYRLVPISEAIGGGNTDSDVARAEPGYGLSVVPLRYVSAQTLMPLIDSFATRTGAVRADPGRNILLIQGSGTERRAAIDTVLKFDADWMRGQSVGVYPLRNSSPEPMISELEKVMDAGDGGLSQNIVKFQAIARMNAVMVVARKPDLLRNAATWISRLDRADTSAGVRVYRLRYGEAKQTAKVLNEIFVGGSSGGLDQTASQIAPGSGVSVTTSGGGVDPSASSQTRTVQQKLGLSMPTTAQASLSGGKAGNTGAEPAPVGGSSAGPSGALLPGVRITADSVNNSLLIYASQEQYRIIERTLSQLDQPQLQVAIEATVAEVTLNDNLSYGVQFYLSANKVSLLNTISSSADISQITPGFNLVVGSGNNRMILDALHKVTDVKVLSNPSLVVVDNQVATLQVGDEVPISTGSATVLSSSNTVVNTYEYKNTGIILRVVPRVNANGNVRLEIEQEISNVADTTSSSSSTSSSSNPTVSQRKIKSTIAVASGQTVLLAGLISEKHNGTRSGLPVLDQVPVLGEAFSHRDRAIKRTELIVFIRPQIIRDGHDASIVAEELRSKMRGSIGVAPGGPVPRFN